MSTFVNDSAGMCRQQVGCCNELVLALWRLGLGKCINGLHEVSGRSMVITHTGRRSGRTYRTPMHYAEIDGHVYCLARLGAEADWYQNVKANPAVEVWLPDGWWTGTAEELTDEPSHLPLMRQVLVNGGRLGSVCGLSPDTMTDGELKQALGDARLVRITKTAARTGAGGPGDLAWVWPLATVVLFLAALGRRRRS